MRQITLSFDNGPDPNTTPRVLDTLQKHHIAASFFVVGKQLQVPGALDATQRAVREGHKIGNHTYTHEVPLGERQDSGVAEAEIGRTQQLIGSLADPDKLFRPQGGRGKIGPQLFSREALDYVCAGGYTCVLWTSVPGDLWAGVDWVERAFQSIADTEWTLLVLHDIKGGCVTRLDEFLMRLRDSDVQIEQAFPPACVPIYRGEIRQPMDQYVT